LIYFRRFPDSRGHRYGLVETDRILTPEVLMPSFDEAHSPVGADLEQARWPFVDQEYSYTEDGQDHAWGGTCSLGKCSDCASE
jgi:hypothetical protein